MNLRMELFEALVDTVAGVLAAADWHNICTYSIMRVSAGGGWVTQWLKSYPFLSIQYMKIAAELVWGWQCINAILILIMVTSQCSAGQHGTSAAPVPGHLSTELQWPYGALWGSDRLEKHYHKITLGPRHHNHTSWPSAGPQICNCLHSLNTFYHTSHTTSASANLSIEKKVF